MTNWPTKKLGDMATVESGGTPRRSNPAYFGGKIPFVKIEDMLKDPITETDEKITKEGLENSAAKVWGSGTILFSIFATLGRVSELGLDATSNQAVAGIFNIKPEVEPRYLKYFLGKIGPILALRGRGVAQNNLNLSILKKLEIPLPPLPTQKQIVERLDKIAEAQKLNDELIQKSDELFQSLLHKELNPAGKDWEVKKLGELVDFLDNQRKPISDQERQKRIGPYPYYGANGQVGWIDDFIFNEDLVLLAEDGGYFGSKDRPIAYRISGKTWVNNHAHVLRVKRDIAETGFIHHRLMFYDIKPYITGSTRTKLNKSAAEKIKIPLPPLATQKQIVAKLSAVQEYKKQLLEQKSLLQELFESVLHRDLRFDKVIP